MEGARVIDFVQIGIAVTGTVAVFLTQCERIEWRRFACIFGMLGQPCWLYAAWKADQTGVLFVSVLYAMAWAKGIHTHWLKGLTWSR